MGKGEAPMSEIEMLFEQSPQESNELCQDKGSADSASFEFRVGDMSSQRVGLCIRAAGWCQGRAAFLAARRSAPLTLPRCAYASEWPWLRHFAAMAMTTSATPEYRQRGGEAQIFRGGGQVATMAA